MKEQYFVLIDKGDNAFEYYYGYMNGKLYKVDFVGKALVRIELIHNPYFVDKEDEVYECRTLTKEDFLATLNHAKSLI